jgi:hypothetical protein
MERVFKLPFKLILKDKAKANQTGTHIINIFHSDHSSPKMPRTKISYFTVYVHLTCNLVKQALVKSMKKTSPYVNTFLVCLVHNIFSLYLNRRSTEKMD